MFLISFVVPNATLRLLFLPILVISTVAVFSFFLIHEKCSRSMLPEGQLPRGSTSLRSFTNFVVAPEYFPVTDALFSRLTEADVASVKQTLSEPIEFSEGVGYQREIIAGAVMGKVTRVLEKIGLDTAHPPFDVHALTRGKEFTTGGLEEADKLLEALRFVNVTIEDLHSVLDFGGSSGRVVRVLSTAWLDKSWWMCDPNSLSIKWASANVIGAKSFVSPQFPPLKFEPGSLDMVFALSIWSHYGERLSRLWFAEIHRLLKPGKYFVFTAHGYSSLRFFQESKGVIISGDLRVAQETLFSVGFWFSNAKALIEPNWGVLNPEHEWGASFFTQDWLAKTVEDSFRIIYCGVASHREHQDLYILEKL